MGNVSTTEITGSSVRSRVLSYGDGIVAHGLDPLEATKSLPLPLARAVLQYIAYRLMVEKEVCPDCHYPVGPDDAVPSGDCFHHADCWLDSSRPYTEPEKWRFSRVSDMFDSPYL